MNFVNAVSQYGLKVSRMQLQRSAWKSSVSAEDIRKGYRGDEGDNASSAPGTPKSSTRSLRASYTSSNANNPSSSVLGSLLE